MSPSPAFVRGGRRAPTPGQPGMPAPASADQPPRRSARRPARRHLFQSAPGGGAGARRPSLGALRGRITALGGRVAAASAPQRDAVAVAWASVRRRVAPVTSMVSALGWLVIAGALVLGSVGWTRGWLESRTLALILTLLTLAAVGFTLGRWEYAAAIELGNQRVKIGDLALGRVEVRNASSRAAASSRVELPVGRNVAALRVPRLGAGEVHEEVFQVPARRRGVITVGPVRSVRTDPLGLLHRQRTWTEPVELFVHPSTVLLDTRAIGFLRDVEGVTTQNLSSSDVSFHALRDYVPGDDRRAIHWRTTARVGKLMVRQFEETMRSHLLLVLSLRPDDYVQDADFELAVSVLGSLGQAAIREERQLSVYTSAGKLEFPSAVGLLDALCRLERDPKARSLRELATEASRRVPGASMVSVIVGSAVEPAELRGAQLALPTEATTFALRCGLDLVAARRKASTLLVLDIASLTDLQRGLRTLR